MRRFRRNRQSLLGAATLALAATALADEGLWTFEHIPRELIAARRGVTLDDTWLSRTQLASVRLAGGCSATFVSPRGLMITSRQCVESCLGENTTASANLAKDGFSSRSPIDEKRCRRLRGQVLLGSEDITGQIALATAGLEAAAAAGARDRELVRLEQTCEQSVDPKAPPVDCEPVVLHAGGEYRLYRYLDFDDLRLSFAPERVVAQLSGEPFEFPRLAFDVALLHAYAEGKPVDSPAFIRVNFAGPAEREPLFVSGHPAETARNTTVAQLLGERDTVLKNELLDAAELRGRYTQFGSSSAATREHIAVPLLRLERELARRDAMFTALLSEPQLAARLAGEATLRQRISTDPDLKLSAGSAFDEIAAAQDAARRLGERRLVVASVGERSELCGLARLIVRAGIERQKPDAQRPPQFRTMALPLIERSLGGGEPVMPDVEMLNLTFSLERLRDRLGTSDPLVVKILGSESPAALAERVISRTRMVDPAFRSQLWSGGGGAVVASDDPLIAIIRDLEAAADAMDSQWRPTVEAPMRRAGERLARARMKFADSSSYPDATGTLRLSSGTMLGWTANGQAVAPLTTLAQAFASTNAPAGGMPARWVEAADRITGTAGFNIAVETDIGAGCTGCAILSAPGDLVGVVIGGNRESAAGRYWFNPTARAVGLDAAALKELLLKVYRAEDLMKEMVIAR